MNNMILIIMLLLLVAPYLALQSVPLYYHIKYCRHRRSHRDKKK